MEMTEAQAREKLIALRLEELQTEEDTLKEAIREGLTGVDDMPLDELEEQLSALNIADDGVTVVPDT